MPPRLRRSFWLSLLAIASFLVLSYFPLSKTRAANAGATILPSAGKPLVNLKNPQSLKVTYVGSSDAVAALQVGTATPTALAAADFDSDGAMDVVAGYSAKSGGGVVVLLRGNPDAYAPKDSTLYKKAMKDNVPATFLPNASVFAVPESPDLMVTGDFNRDGYQDVLVAAHGSALYLLAGTGTGSLLAPQLVPLAGQVMGMAASADGHLAVSLDGARGPQLAILSPGSSGLTLGTTYPLPARGDSVTWANLGGGADVAVGAGANVVLIYGALTANPQTETVSVPFQVQALTSGDFIWDRDGRTEIAALANDGSIHILQHGTLDTRPLTAADAPGHRAAMVAKNKQAMNPTALGAWKVSKQVPYTVLAGAGPVSSAAFSSPRLAASSTHDLMVIDSGKSQLNILDTSGKAASPSAGISLSGLPVAALALPQKINAARDIVVLAAGQAAPVVVTAAPEDIDPAVNTTADTDAQGACAQNSAVTVSNLTGAISLRTAICAVNNSGAGTYTINVPSGMYAIGGNGSFYGGAVSTNESGELQVGFASGQTISIVGSGATTTIIEQIDGTDRVFEQDQQYAGNVAVSISGVTITGGTCTTGLDCQYGGGGMAGTGTTGDNLTVTNVAFVNNSTTTADSRGGGGGLLSGANGNITVNNCTFSGNSASNAAGGGLYFNTSQGSGTLSVTNSIFTGNSAGGVGGGIYANDLGVTVTMSRIVGNTGPGGGMGVTVDGSGNGGTLVDNWWGCNAGPGSTGCDTVNAENGATAPVSPYLVLSISASPAQGTGDDGTSTLTADLTHDSSGNSGFPVPDGTPVGFGGTLGTPSPTNTTTSSGTASSTYTLTTGAGTGTATVDNATVSTPLTSGTTLGVVKASSGTFTQGSTGTWTITVSNTGTSATSGTLTVTDSLANAYTLSSYSGGTGNNAWSCTGTGTSSVSCTNTKTVAAGANYPVLTLVVNIPATSPVGESNTATASGGGASASATSNTATVTVVQVPASITASSGTPQSTQIGTAFANPLKALVEDAGGVAIQGASVVFLAPATGASGTFSNTTTTITKATDASGIASEAFTANNTPGGPYTVTAMVGSIGPANFSLTNQLAPLAPAITSAASATFTVGTAGTFTVTTTGSPTPGITKGVGALPSGVTFQPNEDGTATIAGTPAAGTGGTYTFNINAKNGVTPNAQQSFALTVDQAPAITSASSATFTVGTGGTFTVTTTGFPTPSLSQTGATLPSGLSFKDNGDGTGTLSGTPAAGTGGVYNIGFTASNGVGTAASQPFTLTVDQAPTFTSLNKTTFTVGVAGSYNITTAAGTNPTPIFTETGALPSGVIFTDNGNGTATLSGTPAAGTGATYTLAIKATNTAGTARQNNFTLTIDQSPAITSANNTTFTVGTAGTFTVTTTGFPTPNLSQTGATLPSGLTFVDNGDGTGTLSGTPAAGTGGVYNINFVAKNMVSPQAKQPFTLTVDGPPTITSANNTTFTTGKAGSFTVTASGYPNTFTFSEIGALPSGVTLSSAGVLSGTPAAGTGGTYSIVITVSNGTPPNGTQNFTLTVDQPPAITSANSTTFTVGTLGSFNVTATGYPAPTFTETGALPSGVTLSSAGLLSGTPAVGTGGVYSFTITAKNGTLPNATQNFTLTVDEAPSFTSANSAGFNIGAAGSFTVTTLGYPKPSITEAGPLPNGLAFVDNGNGTGTLSGTPLVFDGGNFSITFTAKNGIGSPATQPFTIILGQSPAFTSVNSAAFTYGVPSSFTVTTTGFPTPSLHEAGGLPVGVTFIDNGNGTATLAGTPLSGGTFNLVLTATNAVTTTTQNFTLKVSGLAFSPSNVNFYIVYLNSSTTVNVKVTNYDAFAVNITGVSITPGTADAASYQFVNNCTATLNPNASCTIAVTFVPDMVGTLTATLNVTDNAPGSPQQISLSGTAIDPAAQFKPTSVPFGTQPVGSVTTVPVRLTNSGLTPLIISNIAITGTNSSEFTQVNNCPEAPVSLPSTKSCTISVTFAPTVKGARTGTLTVTDNVAAGKSTVALSGTGD